MNRYSPISPVQTGENHLHETALMSPVAPASPISPSIYQSLTKNIPFKRATAVAAENCDSLHDRLNTTMSLEDTINSYRGVGEVDFNGKMLGECNLVQPDAVEDIAPISVKFVQNKKKKRSGNNANRSITDAESLRKNRLSNSTDTLDQDAKHYSTNSRAIRNLHNFNDMHSQTRVYQCQFEGCGKEFRKH